MHDDDFFTRVLLSIPMVLALWFCVWLTGKLHKRGKDSSTNESQEKKGEDKKLKD